jgi:hypothetical protein
MARAEEVLQLDIFSLGLASQHDSTCGGFSFQGGAACSPPPLRALVEWSRTTGDWEAGVVEQRAGVPAAAAVLPRARLLAVVCVRVVARCSQGPS